MKSAGAPKENENPTIRSTERGRSSAKRQPLQWSQLGSFEQQSHSEDASWIPTSAEDKAILNALMDVKRAKVTGVSLMENAGLKIPLAKDPVVHYPVFQVTESRTRDDIENKQQPSKIERDLLTAEEVFDIIRNIQDPEHPHTLEQLGVVNLEHIKVVDEGTTPGTLSTVHVGIT
jgi:hypothetical protein